MSEARIALLAPVVEVTLLEDRAHVTRRGRVALAEGQVTVAVDGVAPVLADKTATCRRVGTASDAGAVTVAAVRVERRARILAADKPADVAAIEAALIDAERARQGLQDTVSRLAGELALASQARELLLADAGEDAAWGQAAPERWASDLAALSEREARLDGEIADAQSRGDLLDEEIADLRARRAAAASSIGPGGDGDGDAAELAATLVVTLSVARPGDYELELGYVVPGACWRPAHAARLIEPGGAAGARVEITSEATIWQRTGEAWDDVALACSTERPSLGTAAPTLTSDVLRLRRKEAVVVVESRDEVVETVGPAPVRATAELPGIDDGGEARLLRVRGRAHVPADGRPHRFPLSTFETPAELALVLAAERAPAVIRRSRQANAAAQPLLAGPVDLVRRNGPAGRASILFVAPGARFDLGWGPEGDLRVHRAVEEKDEKEKLLSSWRSRRTRVELAVSNLGPAAHTVEVIERIPVSEIDKVEIELDGPPVPPARPDGEGFLRWTITVAPRSQERLSFAYRIKKHADVTS